MEILQRRRVASTSSFVVWCVGAGSLDACGSSSARADTSHTVTGRPPRATLAWRRISRRPSTNGSRCVTEAPTRTPVPGGPPHARPPLTRRILSLYATLSPKEREPHMTPDDARIARPPRPPSPARRAPPRQIEGPRDRERIPTVVVPDHDDLAVLLADRVDR